MGRHGLRLLSQSLHLTGEPDLKPPGTLMSSLFSHINVLRKSLQKKKRKKVSPGHHSKDRAVNKTDKDVSLGLSFWKSNVLGF